MLVLLSRGGVNRLHDHGSYFIKSAPNNDRKTVEYQDHYIVSFIMLHAKTESPVHVQPKILSHCIGNIWLPLKCLLHSCNRFGRGVLRKK